jgi:hypothetical protein
MEHISRQHWFGAALCRVANDARDTRTIQDYLGTSLDPVDRALHRACQRAVCRLVAGLNGGAVI